MLIKDIVVGASQQNNCSSSVSAANSLWASECANLQQSYVRLKPSGPLFTAKLCKSEKEHGRISQTLSSTMTFHYQLPSTHIHSNRKTESLWSMQIFTFVSGPIQLCLMNKHKTFLLRKHWKYAVLERLGTIHMKITNTGKELVHTFSFILSHMEILMSILLFSYTHIYAHQNIELMGFNRLQKLLFMLK